VILLAKDEKLIKKFQSEPLPKDIDFDEMKKYLELFDFEIDRQSGSHVIFVHKNPNLSYPIPLKNGRYVKSRYLKEINKKIMEINNKEN
jgi:predicted RNA binding protein YcfA (HicA-like mRNA interferase family)